MKERRTRPLGDEKDFDQRKKADENRVVEEKMEKSRKHKYTWTQKGNMAKGGF